ncbi:MAG: lanthionine synthetase C family protein [Pseudomonadota bacterium]
MQSLFDPARHEPLTQAPWTDAAARQAIERICTSAEAEFDAATGTWLLHPQDEPPEPGYRSHNLYFGAAGVMLALRHLASQGAVKLQRDHTPWIAQLPERAAAQAAEEQHGNASYLFGESGALLLAWMATRRDSFADRLFDVVQGNLHNPVNEPLWGNSGTVLAAIHMAEASADSRWRPLVQQAVQALLDDMIVDPDTGPWTWQQGLYGKSTRYVGAGHGLAGNAYPALRGTALVASPAATELMQRTLDTLSAIALPQVIEAATGPVELINWHVVTDADRLAAWLAKGGHPLVQDCHGAPGIVCRLASAPRTAEWDRLLLGAGELTWHAGPLAKGPSLCHGTAGNAMACLKLWRRFGDERWLARGRQLALHAAEQVELARAQHGQGRHSLWTGDLGVACTLWSAVRGEDQFPTLDHF